MDPNQYTVQVDNQTFTCALCVGGAARTKKRTIDHITCVHLDKHTYNEGFPDERSIVYCKKGCAPRGHYHCFRCANAFRKDRINEHIRKCGVVHHPSLSCGATASKLPKPDTVEDDIACAVDPIDVYPVAVDKVVCNVCNKSMLKKNIKAHTLLKHSLFKNPISVSRYHDGVCLNMQQGVYLLNSVLKGGTQFPIHVQKSIHGQSEQTIYCESKNCEALQLVASMSGRSSFECPHLQSVQYITASASNVPLLTETLDWLIELRRIDDEKKQLCVKLKYEAECLQNTFVAAWVQEKFIFISVWIGKKTDYSRFGRVVVSFDKLTYDLICWCTHSSHQGCLHKTIAKWYLAEAFPEIYTSPGQSM